MASKHTAEIMKEMERVRNQQTKSTKVEPTIEERNTRILNLLDQGIKVKEVAARMGVTAATVYQLKSLAKKDKPVEPEEEKKEIKPLREKEITINPVVVEKSPKQSTTDVLEEKMSISSSDELNSLKTQLNDLKLQLDRYRENEKNMHLQNIEQKLSFEKQLAAERVEKEKAYADYSSEIENNKRLRKQVEDLLMIDGLNVGLMQQNLMFRKRFGMMQEGEQL